MRKNSLTVNNGLSLSQAQSISNLCHQRAREIQNQFNKINNAQKSVKVLTGSEVETHVTVTGNKLPENIVALVLEKGKLHACQGFLMENIKAKEAMLVATKKMAADLSKVPVVDKPQFVTYVPLYEVTEEFGWEQLSASEISEYTEAEAYAAHIGSFIHEGSVLDNLRKELPTLPAIEWMSIKDGERIPVKIEVHHKQDELLATHEELAKLHRKYEQRVNYFKAKVKNLTTAENARIAKINSDGANKAAKENNDLQVAYETKINERNEMVKTIQAEFENERQAKIMEIASMRIKIDPRFQETIDLFLKELDDKDSEQNQE
jgi:hypothetical protein